MLTIILRYVKHPKIRKIFSVNHFTTKQMEPKFSFDLDLVIWFLISRIKSLWLCLGRALKHFLFCLF
jgi:hypothetical protein